MQLVDLLLFEGNLISLGEKIFFEDLNLPFQVSSLGTVIFFIDFILDTIYVLGSLLCNSDGGKKTIFGGAFIASTQCILAEIFRDVDRIL